MSSDDEYSSLYSDQDRDLLTRLIGTCVAQINHYSSTAGAMYFMTRHDVMIDLSFHITKLYDSLRGKTKSAAARDTAYVKFYQWFKSENCTKQLDPNYAFSDPFIVGSSWTPLRHNMSNIDVIISIKSEKIKSPSDLDKPRDSFVQAMCKTFDHVQAVLVKKNTLVLKIDSTRKMLIHLVPYNPRLPFPVRLTWALNQYDDFLDDFSAIAHFTHTWFRRIEAGCKATGKTVIPSPTSINYLLIFFLQYYYLVPEFFLQLEMVGKGPAPNPDEKEGGFIEHIIPTYAADVYNFFKYFDSHRKDRKPNAGEILTMFFFFYGYLVDLPHVVLNVVTTKMTEKYDISCEALSIVDSDKSHGSEVPDAHRLQFLFRQGFHAIKNTDESDSVYDSLMRLKYNENFNMVRDRMMTEDPARYSIFQKSFQAKTDADKDDDESNYHGLKEVGKFIAKEYGDRRLFLRKNVELPLNVQTERGCPPFSDEMHAVKNFFKKPSIDQSVQKVPDIRHLIERANNLFQITILPNPNDFSELSVVFRPPQSETNKLIPIVDNYLDDAIGYGEPIIEDDPRDEPNQLDAIKAGCYKDMDERIRVRKMYLIANESREQSLNQVRQPVPSDSLSKLTQDVVSKACEKLDIGEGFMRFTDFEKNLKELEERWFESQT